MADRLSILIPAYNEAASIAELLGRVQAFDASPWGLDLEIIVCDDGSVDRTVAEVERFTPTGDLWRSPQHAGGVAERVAFRVVRHDANQGKGAAIRSALAVATGRYVLIQDADLEYEVSDYAPILDVLTRGAPVVFGSRFLTRAIPAGMRFRHLLANKLLTGTANLLYGMGITDEATCLKAFETDLLRSLNLTCTGFEFCPEVTAKLGLRHVPVKEVPIRYQARSTAAGKKIRWHHGVEALWVLIALRFRRNPFGSR